MAAYSSLLSLMHTMEQIQRHTRFPLSLDKKQIESLHENITFLIDFLETYSHKEVNDLESRIADAAYAAEDIIESYVVNTITAMSTGKTEKTPILSCLQGIEKVIEEMDFIKEEAMKIKGRRETEVLQPRNPTIVRSSSSVPFPKSAMMGFDDELIQIMELLAGKESNRLVIPIVGMGGIGKTTLTQKAFEKPFIVQQFDIRAWVSISQEYSRRKILSEVLIYLRREMDVSLDVFTKELGEMSDEQLGERLYKILFGRRYLVVMDDMWSTEAWEIVKSYFPDNSNCSRVIVTTRLSGIATHLGSSGVKMNFLDEDKSWNLLCEKVFTQEGCPLELEKIGRMIVKNCRGLPLSIVVIGGLLAKSERTVEYWEYVVRDTSTILSLEDDEHCMKILSLSYHSLPVHLKPCFLYMGAFPEDKEVRASWLINLWVGEGFLKPNSSKDLEVIGEEYLNDLISRNLILVHRWGSNGKVKFCNIHDLLRDLCLREADKEKFMYVPDMHSHDIVQGINSQRRISFHQSSSEEKHLPRVLDTLKLGSLARSLICSFRWALPLQNFRLLRVLKAAEKRYNFDAESYLLDDIFQLVNSRCMAFRAIWNSNSTFPSSLGLLWNLQILIVTGTWEETTLPLEILEMTELRHIEFYTLNLPHPSSQQTNVALKNLQTLSRLRNFRYTNEAVMRIPNIKKLSLKIIDSSIGALKDMCLKNLGLLKNLESLSCSIGIRNPSRPDVLLNLPFPISLKKLTLYGGELFWEDMTIIGSLPHLEVLKVKDDAFRGSEWTPVEEEFRRLKFLLIDTCDELVDWVADSIHFPCLEHLILRGSWSLVEIPSGIGEIPTLQSIELDRCSKSANISAKNILAEQEDMGNVGLQVRVFCLNMAELEILASDNFQVQNWEIPVR